MHNTHQNFQRPSKANLNGRLSQNQILTSSIGTLSNMKEMHNQPPRDLIHERSIHSSASLVY